MDGSLVFTMGLDEGSVRTRFGIDGIAGLAEGCTESCQAVSEDVIGTNEAVSEIWRGITPVAPSVCCSVVIPSPVACSSICCSSSDGNMSPVSGTSFTFS